MSIILVCTWHAMAQKVAACPIVGSHKKYQVCVVLGMLIHARIGAYVYLDSIMDASMGILTE